MNPVLLSLPVRPARGFTLLEVLIATVLVGVAVVSTSWAMAAATRVKLETEATAPVTATMVAQEIYELAKRLPAEPSGVVGATRLEDALALDSLVGAVFSPPIRADGSAFVGVDDWSQEVDLEVYGLSDLETKAVQSALDGLSGSDPQLFQLVVVIKDGDQELDTFRWFLTP